MAAMVANRGGSQLSSSISVQEKGSRNKRKFRSDPPLTEPNKLAPLQTECPDHELLTMENALNNPNLEEHASVCDLCRTLTYGPREEQDFEEFHDADWSDLTETQLKELVLSNLDTIYKSAIKKIASYGYTEEVATGAVLRSGLCYGCKDTISNIVDNALAFLRSGQEMDSSLRENIAEDLQKLEKNVLSDMVSVLREVRPFFSTGDAMWCLLICDMNVSHACALDGDSLIGLGNDDMPCSSTSTGPQLISEPNSNTSTSPTMPGFNVSRPSKLNLLLPRPQSDHQPEIPTVVGIPNLPSGRFSASSNMHGTSPNLNPGKDLPVSLCDRSSSPAIPKSYLSEEKLAGSKKGHIGTSKRESILRQKSIHFEKSYRAYGSKAAFRAGKLSSLGGLILDKKCKSISDTTGINLKSTSLKLSKAVGTDTTQAHATLDLSFSAEPSANSSFSNPSPLTTANTELSLSVSSNNSDCASLKPNCSTEAANCSSCSGNPPDEMCGQWVPQDSKDELLLKLAPRMRELQAQLQEWTEWAQQKVMQAARRLSKDKAELQTLRQEKEEVARLRKEKQTLEENTMKKLAEMENALSKASGQVDRANATVRRLEFENSELRQEMEAAKLRAAESAASCQEVSRREMDTVKKFQSWERQKALLQEELVIEKRKLSQLQQQLDQAKEYRDQLEARWRQEEKVKDEALVQANSERKEREQIEVSAKAKEDTIRLKAESDLQIYKDDIRRLENQISQLRLTTDSSKIAALRCGIDGSYASRLSNGRKGSNAHFIAEMMDSQETGGDVERERECVMCLTEEMSVVFLPCAHQVVCIKCNELHEKQGMKDCPSCRTPIQQRIYVRSADS